MFLVGCRCSERESVQFLTEIDKASSSEKEKSLIIAFLKKAFLYDQRDEILSLPL